LNTKDISWLFKQQYENYRDIRLHFSSFKWANAFCKEVANVSRPSLNIEYERVWNDDYKSSIYITYNVSVCMYFNNSNNNTNKKLKQLVTKYRKHIIW